MIDRWEQYSKETFIQNRYITAKKNIRSTDLPDQKMYQ